MDKINVNAHELYKRILPHIKDKTVLDCGCVGGTDSIHNPEWKHEFIRQNARELVGVDLNDVSKFNDDGYNMVQGNIEDVNLNRKFDVIIASHIIEHINNVGLFLDNVKEHLVEGGVLIIVVPNTFNFRWFFKSICKLTNDPTCNPDHVSWHTPATIKSLLNRYGFVITKLSYFSEARGLTWLTTKLFGRRFGNTMLIETGKRD